MSCAQEPAGSTESSGVVLAVDCGGSRTSGLVIDSGGSVRCRLSGSAANLQTAGAAQVALVIRQLLARAPQAERIAAGVAGLRGEDEADLLLTALRDAGIACPVALYPDARIALRAGTAEDGVVVVAGTGVSAYGRRLAQEARVGGWGSLLGDDGGAFWMISRLTRAGLRALDEGDTAGDSILPAMLAAAGLADPSALRPAAAGPDGVARVAGCLPAAVHLWQQGHPLARALLAEAATEISRLARLVAEKIGLSAGYPLILTGGMAAAFPVLASMVRDASGGTADARRLTVDPAWGAYLLAREEDSWRVAGKAAVPATERANPASERLAELSTLDLLTLMNEQDATIPATVSRCLPVLADLVDRTAERMRTGGRLLYLGAGTSGRLAMLDAVECVPTFGIPADRVVALVAGGEAALTRAVEGAEDDNVAGRLAIDAASPRSEDTVVGVSASGRAPYVLAGLERAREQGTATALITCNPGALSLDRWDYCVVAPVGPEVIAGSTRLKAGTAQKLLLNMLSTAVMVRLGRTAGNRMVGVRPTNTKLRERAIRLTAELSGATPDRAQSALEACDWDVTAAVLTVRTGDRARAQTLLREAHGDLARALQLAD